ncbi:hypothetical protein RB195_007652 [Necator americanus]|uniref:Uncharacterized protein n=1 Tax=Necator americanus TaxID=51031 RepID=A0ABR1BZV4_NECAM
MKVFFLLLLHLANCAVDPPDYSKFPRITPAKYREGHRYYIDVDNVGSDIKYKPIAIYVHGKEIVFGEFNEDNPCATFASYHTTIQKCQHNFFLLHADFDYFERKPLSAALDDKTCNIVGFEDSIIVLAKYDVMDPNSPKAVGTYSRKRDAVYYVDHLGNKVSFRRWSVKIKKLQISPLKFDVLCRGYYTYF